MGPKRLLAVGRLKPGPEADLFALYNARLRPPLAVTEVPEARGSAAEVRRREGAALLAALPDNALRPSADPQTARTARITSSGKRMRFSWLPP